MAGQPKAGDVAVPDRGDIRTALPSGQPGDAKLFPPTRWELLFSARNGSESCATDALNELCRIYWFPLYAFVRHRGYSPEEAEDLTQEFVARLLGSVGKLADVDQSKGRFRCFLLASLRNFLTTEWRKRVAEKRGGGRDLLSIDIKSAEGRMRHEPTDPSPCPDRAFDLQWASALLEDVLATLRVEYAGKGNRGLFDALCPYLAWNEDVGRTYAEVADALGSSLSAVKMGVFRLRQRYRQLLREQVALTVDSPLEIDDEINHLFALFERP